MSKPTKPVDIGNEIYWVGALNPEMRRFDVIMETEFGSSYNSYIVKGDSKIALIDAVRDGYLKESLALIRQVVDPIDYIIIQHTEPDHTGALAELLDIATNAKIYCSKPASSNLPLIAQRELPLTVVKDGDSLELGNRKLRFISAPFLHWPDTIFTYDENSGALFTCDAFGCHYSPENVLESKTDPRFKHERKYYYDCIVAPYAAFVKKAIASVKEKQLKITSILPSHGPVLDENPMEAVEQYDAWSRQGELPEGHRLVFIPYVSSYGYTEQLAKEIATELASLGVETDVADIAALPTKEVTDRIYAAHALAIGSPTVNADALPPIWNALSHLAVPLVRGKKAIVFGDYGWSGEGVPFVEQRLNNLGFKVAGTLKVRFKPDEQALSDARALARTLAEAMG